LLKGASLAKDGAINCINLDAHSDYRVMEGRHSGNGFRYAKDAGYLSRYAMVGLHRPYNSQAVLADIRKDADLHCSFYEDIFLKEELNFSQAVDDAILHTAGWPTGIELDLDCIAGVLSSAVTPCGIAVQQARQYLRQCMLTAEIAYVHLTEGAVQLRDGRSDNSTAKLIAYLVHDVIDTKN
jgi:formiminoglutamase